MAFVQADSNDANPATSLELIFNAPGVSVGDAICVVMRGVKSGASCADNLGNTYTNHNVPDSNSVHEAFTAPITSPGACTITVTNGGSARMGVAAHHFSGMSALPFDLATAVQTTTGTAFSTPQFTPSQANVAIVAAMGGSTAGTPEADYNNGLTAFSGNGRLRACYRIAATQLTNETVDWTGSSNTYTAFAIVLREAAGGTPEARGGYASSTASANAAGHGITAIGGYAGSTATGFAPSTALAVAAGYGSASAWASATTTAEVIAAQAGYAAAWSSMRAGAAGLSVRDGYAFGSSPAYAGVQAIAQVGAHAYGIAYCDVRQTSPSTISGRLILVPVRQSKVRVPGRNQTIN